MNKLPFQAFLLTSIDRKRDTSQRRHALDSQQIGFVDVVTPDDDILVVLVVCGAGRHSLRPKVLIALRRYNVPILLCRPQRGRALPRQTNRHQHAQQKTTSPTWLGTSCINCTAVGGSTSSIIESSVDSILFCVELYMSKEKKKKNQNSPCH